MQNIEELIFYDQNIKKILPEFADLFNQWAFAKSTNGFRQLAKRTASDLLTALQQEQLNLLSQYFGEKITIDKLDYHTLINASFDLEDIELKLNEFDDFNFSIFRDNKEKLHITFWR